MHKEVSSTLLSMNATDNSVQNISPSRSLSKNILHLSVVVKIVKRGVSHYAWKEAWGSSQAECWGRYSYKQEEKEADKLSIKEIHDLYSLSNSSVIKFDKEYKSSLIISIITTYNFGSFNHAELDTRVMRKAWEKAEKNTGFGWENLQKANFWNTWS